MSRQELSYPEMCYWSGRVGHLLIQLAALHLCQKLMGLRCVAILFLGYDRMKILMADIFLCCLVLYMQLANKNLIQRRLPAYKI